MRTGLGLMGLFTIFWSAWATFSGSVVLVAIGALGIGAGVTLLIRRAGLPAQPSGGATHRASSRTLLVALAVESVAIVVVVVVLRSIDPDLIQPAIAVVVGLHFLIFYASRATRGRLHLLTTTVAVLIGLAGLLAITRHQSPPVVHGLVGLGMSGVTLAYGIVFARTLIPSPPASPPTPDP